MLKAFEGLPVEKTAPLDKAKKIAMFPTLRVAKKNLTRAAGIAFFWVFWNQNNVLQFTLNRVSKHTPTPISLV